MITGALGSHIYPLSLSLYAFPDRVLILSSAICYSYFYLYFSVFLRSSKV